MSQRENLKNRAYEFLREAIVTGRLEDGSQHSIYGISDELGISRTPVREAVLQLANVGLVSIEKNRGFRIRGTSVKRLQDIFELRLLLEVPAAFGAAANHDVQLIEALHGAVSGMSAALAENDEQAFRSHDRLFHDLIARAAGNQQLCSTLDSLREVIVHPVSNYGVRDSQEIIDEHAHIADAIARGDALASVHAMRAHLVNTADQLLEHLSMRTGEPSDPKWSQRLNVPIGG